MGAHADAMIKDNEVWNYLTVDESEMRECRVLLEYQKYDGSRPANSSAHRGLRWGCGLAGLLVLISWSTAARAIDDYDSEPIRYSTSEPSDPAALLQKELDAGKKKLRYDKKHGYLKSVLEAFQIPISSQMLVFSKTSFQIRKIEPRTPRAIYFSDDVYIGWVQRGDVLEISTVDPQLGAIFYSLDQKESESPRFKRRTHECLQCHASRRTQDVPGHVVRSLYTAYDGRPIFNAGSFNTDHSSPMNERWGGWYVTGKHGKERHMGNVLVIDRKKPQEVNRDAGANITDLDALFDTSPYLSPHSDIVAMMVMAHQAQMHNHIAAANFQTRQALHSNTVMNRALDRPKKYRSPSTQRRVKKAAERLLRYLLFANMAELHHPVTGTNKFAAEFMQKGPRDKRGRSLRKLNLKTRLFEYPCSFLIYTDAFVQLPGTVKSLVYRRLWEVLTGRDDDEDFDHLTAADKQAILEILRDTKPNLPKYWRATEAPPKS